MKIEQLINKDYDTTLILLDVLKIEYRDAHSLNYIRIMDQEDLIRKFRHHNIRFKISPHSYQTSYLNTTIPYTIDLTEGTNKTELFNGINSKKTKV